MRTRTDTRERDRVAPEEREPVREPAPEIAQMLRLQSGVGNAAVVRLMRSPSDQERWEEDWNTPAYVTFTGQVRGQRPSCG